MRGRIEIFSEGPTPLEPVVVVRKFAAIELRSDGRLLGANARHEVLDEMSRLLGDEPVEPAFAHRKNREDLLRDPAWTEPRLPKQCAQQSATRNFLLDARLEFESDAGE